MDDGSAHHSGSEEVARASAEGRLASAMEAPATAAHNTTTANANVQANANSQPSQMVEPTGGTPSTRRRRATTRDANSHEDEDEDEEDEDEDEDEDEEDDDDEDEDDDDEEEEEEEDDESPAFMSMPPRQANANQVRGFASSGYGGYASRYSRGPRHDLTGAPAGAGINWMFYAGKSPSLPDRFHDSWWASYQRLEYEHSFIQWLFPVFESSGVNWDAEALSKSEAKLMREDFDIATRVVSSYRLMLNFYGIRLVSEVTGEVARWPGIWRDRYDNLNWSGHNNLRITRILTSLGELGFQRYKKPLLDFLTQEITQNRQLPNCRSSLIGFWSKTLDYSSPAYKAKTKEDPEDREDSVFFRHMAENTAEYQKWVADEAKVLALRERGLEEAQRRDEEEEQRRRESGKETDAAAAASPWSKYGSRWASRWQHEEEDEDEDEDTSDGEKAECAVTECPDDEDDEDEDHGASSNDHIGNDDSGDDRGDGEGEGDGDGEERGEKSDGEHKGKDKL